MLCLTPNSNAPAKTRPSRFHTSSSNFFAPDSFATRSSFSLLVYGIIAFTCAALSAAEPPRSTSWPSFRHDLAQTGVASCTLPSELELLWEATLEQEILATSAIVGDFVYVPCLSGHLVCLNRKNGDQVWSYQSVDVVPKNSFAPGFKSSPTVTADTVYLGDEDGVFHAINRSTGKNRWKYTTGGEIYSSAAVFEGKVIFGSYDNRLYCLNENDGSLAWKYDTDGYVHCAPAIADGLTFIAGCDERLRAIDVRSGTQKFEMPLSTYLIASPAIVGDILYVGTFASQVVAVDWKKQDIVWRYEAGDGSFPFHSSAAVNDSLVVLGGQDKQVHAIRRSNGERAWTFPTRAKVNSSPVIVGNRVFVGSNDGNLYELNLADGQEKWRYNAGKPISAGPAVGEGVLVVGTESRSGGKVFCFGKK